MCVCVRTICKRYIWNIFKIAFSCFPLDDTNDAVEKNRLSEARETHHPISAPTATGCLDGSRSLKPCMPCFPQLWKQAVTPTFRDYWEDGVGKWMQSDGPRFQTKDVAIQCSCVGCRLEMLWVFRKGSSRGRSKKTKRTLKILWIIWVTCFKSRFLYLIPESLGILVKKVWHMAGPFWKHLKGGLKCLGLRKGLRATMKAMNSEQLSHDLNGASGRPASNGISVGLSATMWQYFKETFFFECALQRTGTLATQVYSDAFQGLCLGPYSQQYKCPNRILQFQTGFVVVIVNEAGQFVGSAENSQMSRASTKIRSFWIRDLNGNPALCVFPD